MGDKSPIEWLQGGATWNPIRARLKKFVAKKPNSLSEKIGWACVRISPGCQNCYAERQNVQCGTNPTRAGTGLAYNEPNLAAVQIYLDEKTLLQPLHWKRGRLIFPCSMTDWMAQFVPDEFRDKMLAVMALTPQHTYLSLAKRGDRQREYFAAPDLRERIAREANAMMRSDRAAGNSDALASVFLWQRFENATPGEYANYLCGIADRCWPLPNLWVGVSVESPDYLKRLDDLRDTPAALRWASFEPILADLGDIRERLKFLQWAVGGFESGLKARPGHPQWGSKSARPILRSWDCVLLETEWRVHLHSTPRLGRIRGRKSERNIQEGWQESRRPSLRWQGMEPVPGGKAMTTEMRPSVVYREGPLTPEDYQEAIDFLVEAKQNLEAGHLHCPCGDACSINACHHNPLVMARRGAAKAQEFRCYHCGEVFTTEEGCREHFGEKQDALPVCLRNTALLVSLIKASVELAIIRHDLNSEEGHTLNEAVNAEAIAEDTANAVRGIDTCAPEPIPEWKVLFVSKESPGHSDYSFLSDERMRKCIEEFLAHCKLLPLQPYTYEMLQSLGEEVIQSYREQGIQRLLEDLGRFAQERDGTAPSQLPRVDS